MSLWIRNVIFIGITVSTVLSSESASAISDSYVIDSPEACKGRELTSSYMQLRLEREFNGLLYFTDKNASLMESFKRFQMSVARVHSVSFREPPWYSPFTDFVVSFSVVTQRGARFNNIECSGAINLYHPARGLHMMYLNCQHDEIRPDRIEIPIFC